MSLVIGFDLGTHQTKICVQDATNPAEKTYHFLEFEIPDGTKTVLFPSVVQINKDHTISYGFINEDDVLFFKKDCGSKPELILLEEPDEPKYPSFKHSKLPAKPKFDPWTDNLKKLKGEKTDLELWETECENIKNREKRLWERECAYIKKTYESTLSDIKNKNEKIRKEYQARLSDWKKNSIPEKLLFRYFKLHALTGVGEWHHNYVKSKDICVLYITYILLILKNKYGDDFSIQFGVPCGAAHTQRDKAITKRTYEVFIAASDLADNFNDIDEYLSTPFEEIFPLIEYKSINTDLINQYYFDDIPEAFAGLVAVTLQKKLGDGFHLLVDIGGGTTDVAIFCVDKDNKDKNKLLPNVLHVSSFPKGINFILQEASKDEKLLIEEIQDMFHYNPKASLFKGAISNYRSELAKHSKSIIKRLEESFMSSYSHHERKLEELRNVMKGQPIIFGGGGGTFKVLQTSLHPFSDIRQINKSMLGIRNLVTTDISEDIFTILSTSYGLASFEKSYESEIKCTDIAVAFEAFLPKKYKSYDDLYKHDYGLSDW